MSHNLFGERFYSLRRPAWHVLGYVSQTEMGAAEAFNTISPYSVGIENLTTSSGISVPYRVIVRDPVPDDPNYKIFGIVGPEYKLIDPLTFCETYDAAVGRPIETLGALNSGDTLFLSTKLPEINVNGDLVDSYLLGISPYTGWTGWSGISAIQLRVTHVRVVCNNTLMAAKRASTEVYKIIHDEHAVERLSTWMTGIYERAVQRADALAQAFVLFSEYSPKSKEVVKILNTVYPDPKPVVQNAPDDVIKQRESDYEYYKAQSERSRGAVQELFNGRGTGMDITAAKGTAWGLYNAVVEWEDYRPTTNDYSRAVNALFGDRAQKKELAYAVISEAIAGK